MNQPILCHQQTQITDGTMRGGFNGSYDLDSSCGAGHDSSLSYYEVVWEKKVNVGSWAFKHKLKTSKKYPWLMLYLRADATKGFSGASNIYYYTDKILSGSVGQVVAHLSLNQLQLVSSLSLEYRAIPAGRPLLLSASS
ncbi:hypothetical protein RIF29_17209 [Crotalaria pallida]|uniref:DUF7705 domain-containing protein n=1 Tax=Crotalaria pallida TaxID=3830 RepID=A0AAN9FGN1_CROPI